LLNCYIVKLLALAGGGFDYCKKFIFFYKIVSLQPINLGDVVGIE